MKKVKLYFESDESQALDPSNCLSAQFWEVDPITLPFHTYDTTTAFVAEDESTFEELSFDFLEQE